MMVPPKRRANDPGEGTSQEFDHNPQDDVDNTVIHDLITMESIDMQPIEAHEESNKALEVGTNGDNNAVFTLLNTLNFKRFFDLLGFVEDAWLAAAITLAQIT